MPDDDVVVANTSPLLNLALIDRLDLLEAFFAKIVVPEQVWNELEVSDDPLSGLRSLREGGFLRVVPVQRDELYREVKRELDEGETAAIIHSVRAGADLVLLDERDGRRVARRHGLEVTGVVGILIRGAQSGTVHLPTEIESLRDAGFWIAEDLVEEVLGRFNEG